MNSQALSPEVDSLLIDSAAGPAPMSEPAAAWDAFAAELRPAASFSSVTPGLVGNSCHGQASRAALAPAPPYAGLLNVAAAWEAEQRERGGGRPPSIKF